MGNPGQEAYTTRVKVLLQRLGAGGNAYDRAEKKAWFAAICARAPYRRLSHAWGRVSLGRSPIERNSPENPLGGRRTSRSQHTQAPVEFPVAVRQTLLLAMSDDHGQYVQRPAPATRPLIRP